MPTSPRPLPSHRREWRACPACTKPSPAFNRLCAAVYRLTFRRRWAEALGLVGWVGVRSAGVCAFCNGSNLRRAR